MHARQRAKKRRSSAMAKNTRGAASIPPFTALNDEIITNTDTADAPARPKSASMTSAATSGDRATASTDSM
jgi:hypothetical protein